MCCSAAGCANNKGADDDSADDVDEALVGSNAPSFQRKENTLGDTYAYLEAGASLYAGLVTRVTIEGTGTDHMPVPNWCEKGTLVLRVENALQGKDCQRLAIPFRWREEATGLGTADVDWWWAWDGHPAPTRGQRLLLLIRKEREVPDGLEDVLHVWSIGPNDPLVAGFKDAIAYLTAPDQETRQALFRKMCQSDLKDIRCFAGEAARRLNLSRVGGQNKAEQPDKMSEGMLSYYIGTALPKITDEDEKARCTEYLADLMRDNSDEFAKRHQLPGLFEDWYWTELGALHSPTRQCAALFRLDRLASSRGTEWLAAAFRNKGGRAALIKRIAACAQREGSCLPGDAKALLEKLRAK
jgi:hypothetical protein